MLIKTAQQVFVAGAPSVSGRSYSRLCPPSEPLLPMPPGGHGGYPGMPPRVPPGPPHGCVLAPVYGTQPPLGGSGPVEGGGGGYGVIGFQMVCF